MCIVTLLVLFATSGRPPLPSRTFDLRLASDWISRTLIPVRVSIQVSGAFVRMCAAFVECVASVSAKVALIPALIRLGKGSRVARRHCVWGCGCWRCFGGGERESLFFF